MAISFVCEVYSNRVVKHERLHGLHSTRLYFHNKNIAQFSFESLTFDSLFQVLEDAETA